MSTSTNNNNALSQLDVVTRERDELSRKVTKLFNELAAGFVDIIYLRKRANLPVSNRHKRKEPSDDPPRTLDPRKRMRMMSPEESLRAKIIEQELCISELKGYAH